MAARIAKAAAETAAAFLVFSRCRPATIVRLDLDQAAGSATFELAVA
jgi:hypothetical protein